ncbi:MAG TPA: PAS domain S-box protein [Candidatus Omnitrophota bacterium]|nr:PAS domain S-box protein [Candidatus Omnitrophota bacterium]
MKNLLDKNIELYKQLIDQANVMINAFDSDGNILIWNKASEETTGFTKKEALGNKSIMEKLYPDPEYRKEVLKATAANFEKDYKNVEFTMTTRYGDKKCVSWSAIIIRNSKGEKVGSFAIGIDVTLRNLVKVRERGSFKALLKSVRYHEDDKERYENLIKTLKAEVNVLCEQLGRPRKY